MEAYTYLAKYYDILMKDFDYNAYYNHIKKYLKNKGVDLCCGSGEMTIKLASLFDVYGVDVSAQMLCVARDKARKSGKNILFICEDVLKFKPQKKLDFVTCVCDGLNYIKQDKLKKLIDNVSSYLNKDGYFIFDISSKYKLQNVLGNNVFCEDREDLTYIWSNKLIKNKIEMNLSFFEKEENGLYKRLEEYHTQYIHDENDLIKLLEENFEITLLDGQTFNQPTDESLRLLFVLKRK